MLFSDLGRDWETLRDTGAQLAALGDALPARGDERRRWRGPRNPSPRRSAVADRAAAQAGRVGEAAREAARDLLGDTAGAVSIAERRLRSEQR